MKIDFAHIDSVRISTFLRPREGETKIGERITYAAHSIEESLADFKGQYVLLGVEEDIGPRANLGQPGAIFAFKSFLNRFLNMQVSSDVNIDNLMMLGRVKAETLETGYAKRRQNVAELDDFLVEILILVYKAGKTPIIVGGGHNNAYPLMKAYYLANQRKVDVINLDAHADFRLLEGRHSGNSFSYAMNDGFLDTYTIFGLHRAYNGQGMLEEMKKHGVRFTFFEEYLDGTKDLRSDVEELLKNYTNRPLGVELDLDAIAMMPSSAYSPSGWSVDQARTWLRQVTKNKVPAYLNLTEGACELGTPSDAILGKTLAYMVHDVICR